MSDLQLLSLLETLMRLARSGALPSAACTTASAVHKGARAELAKLGNAAAVDGLRQTLEAKRGGALVPPLVGEAADMLADPKRSAWLVEVGRLAAQ